MSRCDIRYSQTPWTLYKQGDYGWIPSENWHDYLYLNLYGFFYLLGADPGELEYFFQVIFPLMVDSKAPNGELIEAQHILANYGCGYVDPQNPFRKISVDERADAVYLWEDMQLHNRDVLDVYAEEYLSQLPTTLRPAFVDPASRATLRRLIVNAALLNGLDNTEICETKLSNTKWRKRVGYNPRYWSMGATCETRQRRGCFWNGHGGLITGLHDGMLYAPGTTPKTGVGSRPKPGGRATCCHKKYKTDYYPPKYGEARWRRAEDVLKWFYAKQFGKRRTEYLICALMGWKESGGGGWEVEAPTLLPETPNSNKVTAAREIATPWFASIVSMMEAVAVLAAQMPREYWGDAFSAAGLNAPTWNPKQFLSDADYTQWLFLPNLSWDKLRELLMRLVEARNRYYESVGRHPIGAARSGGWKAVEQFEAPSVWQWLQWPVPEKRPAWLPSAPVLLGAGGLVVIAGYIFYRGMKR